MQKVGRARQLWLEWQLNKKLPGRELSDFAMVVEISEAGVSLELA
jgi:hypothetical protein